MITRTVNGVTLALLKGNIVDAHVDAIVNAANAGLAGGGGVDCAIHRAGGPTIMEECRKIGGCATGSAAVTTAGRLKAKHIFHAVGPIYQQRGDEEKLLASTYRTCLELAEKYQHKSIAFPSISTGAYEYPVKLAAPIALREVIAHIEKSTSLQQVQFILFDTRTYDEYIAALKKIVDKE